MIRPALALFEKERFSQHGNKDPERRLPAREVGINFARRQGAAQKNGCIKVTGGPDGLKSIKK